MSQLVKRFDGIIPMKRLLIEGLKYSVIRGERANIANEQKKPLDYKKNTLVSVSFQPKTADWLPEITRNKLSEIHKSNLSKDGYLTIRSDKTNTQTLNLADCMDRLRCYISEAEQLPDLNKVPETIEEKRRRLDKLAARRLAVAR